VADSTQVIRPNNNEDIFMTGFSSGWFVSAGKGSGAIKVSPKAGAAAIVDIRIVVFHNGPLADWG
jgi:hypothetical protein